MLKNLGSLVSPVSSALLQARAEHYSQRLVTGSPKQLPSLCWECHSLLPAGLRGSETWDRVGGGLAGAGMRSGDLGNPCPHDGPMVEARSRRTLTGQQGGCFQSRQILRGDSGIRAGCSPKEGTQRALLCQTLNLLLALKCKIGRRWAVLRDFCFYSLMPKGTEASG